MSKQNGVQVDEKIHYLTSGGGRTVKLSATERIMLDQILPTESDITSLRVIEEIRDQIAFSSADTDRYKVRREGNQIFWDDTVQDRKAISVSKAAVGIIKATLQALNETNRLKRLQISLYEMFVEYSEPTMEEAPNV